MPRIPLLEESAWKTAISQLHPIHQEAIQAAKDELSMRKAACNLVRMALKECDSPDPRMIVVLEAVEAFCSGSLAWTRVVELREDCETIAWEAVEIQQRMPLGTERFDDDIALFEAQIFAGLYSAILACTFDSARSSLAWALDSICHVVGVRQRIRNDLQIHSIMSTVN